MAGKATFTSGRSGLSVSTPVLIWQVLAMVVSVKRLLEASAPTDRGTVKGGDLRSGARCRKCNGYRKAESDIQLSQMSTAWRRKAQAFLLSIYLSPNCPCPTVMCRFKMPHDSPALPQSVRDKEQVLKSYMRCQSSNMLPFLGVICQSTHQICDQYAMMISVQFTSFSPLSNMFMFPSE